MEVVAQTDSVLLAQETVTSLGKVETRLSCYTITINTIFVAYDVTPHCLDLKQLTEKRKSKLPKLTF